MRPSGPQGRNLKLGLSLACLVLAIVIIAWQLMGNGPSTAEESRRRPVVDAESGEVIEEFRIPETGMYPWTNPKTGKATLYPAEKCFWTKDGKAKVKPTYVLLNVLAGKTGDTICPDCGRKVVAHNPMPPMKLMNEAIGIKDTPAPSGK